MVVGSFTVRAVVFTVVISSPGVCHYQQLLDVTLEGKKEKRKEGSTSVEATTGFTPLRLNWEVFSPLERVFMYPKCQ